MRHRKLKTSLDISHQFPTTFLLKRLVTLIVRFSLQRFSSFYLMFMVNCRKLIGKNWINDTVFFPFETSRGTSKNYCWATLFENDFVREVPSFVRFYRFLWKMTAFRKDDGKEIASFSKSFFLKSQFMDVFVGIIYWMLGHPLNFHANDCISWGNVDVYAITSRGPGINYSQDSARLVIHNSRRFVANSVSPCIVSAGRRRLPLVINCRVKGDRTWSTHTLHHERSPHHRDSDEREQICCALFFHFHLFLLFASPFLTVYSCVFSLFFLIPSRFSYFLRSQSKFDNYFLFKIGKSMGKASPNSRKKRFCKNVK